MSRRGDGICASALIVALAAAFGSACGDDGEGEAETMASAAGPPVARTTAQGPLKATVEVAPGKAAVGDVLRLTLTVDAQPGAQVAMPPFGDALGRFEVVGYLPREEALAGGGRRYVQDYRLQATRSGRLRVPPLRIEYGAAAPAAGRAGPGQAAELLTEEVPVEVESVLTAEGAGSLGAVRGELDEVVGRSWLVPALVVGGALALGLGFLAVRAHRRRRRAAVRRSAAEIAFERLIALERRGLPEGHLVADGWYVELSDIVRRYIEDRFGIRAPELTTEEFLREARRLGELGEPHRALLSAFLEGCDRVKFAGHEPPADESRAALGLARQLIEETMVRASPVPPAIGAPPEPGGEAPVAAEVVR